MSNSWPVGRGHKFVMPATTFQTLSSSKHYTLHKNDALAVLFTVLSPVPVVLDTRIPNHTHCSFCSVAGPALVTLASFLSSPQFYSHIYSFPMAEKKLSGWLNLGEGFVELSLSPFGQLANRIKVASSNSFIKMF